MLPRNQPTPRLNCGSKPLKMGSLPPNIEIKYKKKKICLAAVAPWGQESTPGPGLATGLCSKKVRAGSLLPEPGEIPEAQVTRSTPLSPPGGWAKAQSTLRSGIAPAPRETDLPGLRKTEATLTGLRLTEEKETDTGEQIKRNPGTEKRSQASLFLAGLQLPGLVAGSGRFTLSSGSHLSPEQLSGTNSRLPPLDSQHPIAGRPQTTNHTPRPEIEQPIPARD